MDCCVCVLDSFLSTRVHSSFRLAQLLLSTLRFHQYILPFLHVATLHFPLSCLPPLHGVFQLLWMHHGASAGHDPPLHSNLLEPAGPPEGELSSGQGFSAKGEEAGLLPCSGSYFICHLLDSSASHELPVAVLRPRRRHTGDTLCRQVTQLLLSVFGHFLFLC